MPLTGIERHRIILTAAASAAHGTPRPTRMRIRVDGVAYEVEVEYLPNSPEPDEAEEALEFPDSVLHPPPTVELREEDRICRSPIAGSIVSVAARPGRFLRHGDPVVVIEAMKMQTTIGAPVDGIVEEVYVSAGDAVKPHQQLCRQ